MKGKYGQSRVGRIAFAAAFAVSAAGSGCRMEPDDGGGA